MCGERWRQYCQVAHGKRGYLLHSVNIHSTFVLLRPSVPHKSVAERNEQVGECQNEHNPVRGGIHLVIMNKEQV